MSTISCTRATPSAQAGDAGGAAFSAANRDGKKAASDCRATNTSTALKMASEDSVACAPSSSDRANATSLT